MQITNQPQTLVTAARAAGGETGLGVGGDIVKDLTFFHHDGEVNIGTGRVLVSALTGVETAGVAAIALESFEGVEVLWRTRCAGVESAVNIKLGLHIPHFPVVLAVIQEKSSVLGRKGGCLGHESRSGGGKAEDCDQFGVLSC